MLLRTPIILTLNLIYDTDEDANENGQLDPGEDVDGDNIPAGLRLEARNPDNLQLA